MNWTEKSHIKSDCWRRRQPRTGGDDYDGGGGVMSLKNLKIEARNTMENLISFADQDA